jgi:hypothetical protein
MIINVSYDSSVTSQSAAFQQQFMGAVNAVVQFYEHAFTNNVTVNITFAWSPLSGNAAAENSFYYNTYSYATIRNALLATQHSADDIAAYTTMPVNDPTGTGHLFALTAAQARNLGLGFSAPYDDFVTLNSNLSWTFDPNHRAVAGEYDAIGALEHEVSEGIFGRIGSLGSASAGLGSGIYTPLDLFRYSSPGVHDYSNPGANDFFSIDGTHLLTAFNNHNQNGGDVSDWDPNIVGDSFGDAYTGTVGQVTPTDLRELDVLGWTRAPATTHDFYGNAFSDMLFQNNSTGGVAIWEMDGNGGNIAAKSGVGSVGPNSGWQVAGVGDFNGDYMNDLLWLNSGNGAVALWEMNGSQVILSAAVSNVGPNSGWQVAGLADFYGDGNEDILWINPSNGAVALWELNGAQVTSSAAVSNVGPNSGWQVVGIGDFYGDHHEDLLWFNSTNGAIALWELNGSQVISSTTVGTLGPNSGWQVAGVGDFYGDHHEDVLWFNSNTGNLSLWEMNGAQVVSNANVVGMGAGWHIASVGNYALGGSGTDILWQNNSTGALVLWEMNGPQVTASLNVGSLGQNSSGWHIVA